MWSRSTLKQNAKNVLRGNYWMAFLVCLLASVLTGGLSAGGSGAQVNYNVTDTDLTQLMNGQVDPTLIAAAIGVASMAAAFGLVIGLAFNFFVYGPIKIGQMRYFLESRESGSSVGQLFYGFKGDRSVHGALEPAVHQSRHCQIAGLVAGALSAGGKSRHERQARPRTFRSDDHGA